MTKYQQNKYVCFVQKKVVDPINLLSSRYWYAMTWEQTCSKCNFHLPYCIVRIPPKERLPTIILQLKTALHDETNLHRKS